MYRNMSKNDILELVKQGEIEIYLLTKILKKL